MTFGGAGIKMRRLCEEDRFQEGEMIRIREAVPEDARAILECSKAIGRETDFLLTGPEGYPLSLEKEEALIRQIQNQDRACMYIAQAGDEIVALGQIQGNQNARIAHRGYFAVSVRKAYWRQGIGYRLSGKLLAFARGLGLEVVELTVRADNAAAIALYEKLGFVRFGMWPSYMKVDGKLYDCLLMQYHCRKEENL